MGRTRLVPILRDGADTAYGGSYNFLRMRSFDLALSRLLAAGVARLRAGAPCLRAAGCAAFPRGLSRGTQRGAARGAAEAMSTVRATRALVEFALIPGPENRYGEVPPEVFVRKTFVASCCRPFSIRAADPVAAATDSPTRDAPGLNLETCKSKLLKLAESERSRPKETIWVRVPTSKHADGRVNYKREKVLDDEALKNAVGSGAAYWEREGSTIVDDLVVYAWCEESSSAVEPASVPVRVSDGGDVPGGGGRRTNARNSGRASSKRPSAAPAGHADRVGGDGGHIPKRSRLADVTPLRLGFENDVPAPVPEDAEERPEKRNRAGDARVASTREPSRHKSGRKSQGFVYVADGKHVFRRYYAAGDTPAGVEWSGKTEQNPIAQQLLHPSFKAIMDRYSSECTGFLDYSDRRTLNPCKRIEISWRGEVVPVRVKTFRSYVCRNSSIRTPACRNWNKYFRAAGQKANDPSPCSCWRPNDDEPGGENCVWCTARRLPADAKNGIVRCKYKLNVYEAEHSRSDDLVTLFVVSEGVHIEPSLRFQCWAYRGDPDENERRQLPRAYDAMLRRMAKEKLRLQPFEKPEFNGRRSPSPGWAARAHVLMRMGGDEGLPEGNGGFPTRGGGPRRNSYLVDCQAMVIGRVFQFQICERGTQGAATLPGGALKPKGGAAPPRNAARPFPG